jgi:hypothetical protein
VLNGHVFMPAADVPWPFTVTSLTSDLVLGYGQTTGNVQVGNETFGGTLDYAGIGGILAYEYGFLDHLTRRGLGSSSTSCPPPAWDSTSPPD